MRMPKLHMFVVHVSQFVQTVGCWAKLGEEGFEHYQSTITFIRSQHSHNQAIGGRICNNLQYAWIRCIPDVAALRAAGEEQASRNSFAMKKRKYSVLSSQ